MIVLNSYNDVIETAIPLTKTILLYKHQKLCVIYNIINTIERSRVNPSGRIGYTQKIYHWWLINYTTIQWKKNVSDNASVQYQAEHMYNDNRLEFIREWDSKTTPIPIEFI